MTDSKWVPIREMIKTFAAFGAKYLFPVVAQLVPVLKIPAWAGAIVTNIVPALMDAVETMHPEPGTGAVKKQKVLDATKGMMEVLEKTFTGGAAGTFEKIRPTLEVLIDSTVLAVNELRKDIIADDPPSPPPIVGN